MKKINCFLGLILLILIFTPTFNYAATWQEKGCMSEVSCVDQDQCACLTSYKLFDENGMETNEFDANEKMYVALTVKNVGTKPIENMKLFYITNSSYAFANGIYSKYYYTKDGSILAGIDLDPDKSKTYSFGALNPVEFVDTIPPGTYGISTYVSSESNKYYQVPRIFYTITNSNPYYVGAGISTTVKKSTATVWAYSTKLIQGDEFDFRIIATNYNKQESVDIKVSAVTSGFESCETAPTGFVPKKNFIPTYNFSPGESKTILFEKCKLAPETEKLGLVYLTTYLYAGTNNAMLRAIYPNLSFDFPTVYYYDLYAEKDYLEGGKPITIYSDYAIATYQAPPGTKIVFSLVDLKNPLISFTEEIVYGEGLPIGRRLDSVTFNYPEGYESDNFKISARVYGPDGTLITVRWGTVTKTYATSVADSGDIYNLDESIFIKSSGYCQFIDVLNNKKRIVCDFDTDTKKVLAIISDKYLISNLDFENISISIIDEYSDGVLMALWPESTIESVVINFTISDRIEADDFGIFEMGLLFIIVLFIFYNMLNENSKPKSYLDIKKEKKAQSGVEYLLILGAVVIVGIIVIITLGSFTDQAKDVEMYQDVMEGQFDKLTLRVYCLQDCCYEIPNTIYTCNYFFPTICSSKDMEECET